MLLSDRPAVAQAKAHRSRLPGAVIVVSTAALATYLVLHRLGHKPLWLDESVSISVASRPLTRLLAVLTRHDANAGLYDLLLHGWLFLGHGAAWDRGVSALCFIATAALAAWIGVHWRGPTFGLACGVLVATNQFLLFYGQEARPYALAVLLAAASTSALFWRGREPAPAAYVATTIALVYADLFAVLFIAAQAVVIVAVHRRRGTPVAPLLVTCWVMIGAGGAPLAGWMLLREHSQISWLTRPSVAYLAQTYGALTGSWLGLALVAGLTVAAICWRRTARDDLGAVVTYALVAAFSLPPFVLWVVAQLVPTFIDRYVVTSSIAATGLLVLGLDTVRERLGRVVSLGILAGLALVGVSHIAALERRPFKYENPPAAVTFIKGNANSGDAIGFGSGGLRMVISVYAAGGQPFPEDVALAQGGEASRQDDLYAREVGAAALTTRLAGVQRLWLITDPSDHRYPSDGAFSPLRSSVTSEFRAAVWRSFPGMDVTLYVRTSPPRRP